MPIPRKLYDYLEARVRRTIECPRCGTHVAVFGATAFCPLCGPREKADEVRDEIAAQRLTLSLPGQLEVDVREQARAAGVFDQHTEATLKDVVTLFETYARGVFSAGAANADQILAKERHSVFQSLDDAERLLKDHLNYDLLGAAGEQVIGRLAVVFQKRHVLVHSNGQIDERYLQRVPASTLKLGQRLVVSQTEAERALDDLELVVDALEGLRTEAV